MNHSFLTIYFVIFFFSFSIMECNICFEFSQAIPLECCKNTKHICNLCLNSLKYPICPYCRSDIDIELYDETKTQYRSPLYNNLSESWRHYIEEETLINPYDYDNSRRLRRQLRKMRQKYQNERIRKEPYNKKAIKQEIIQDIHEDIFLLEL